MVRSHVIEHKKLLTLVNEAEVRPCGFNRGFSFKKNNMIKEEKFTTDEGGFFELSIGDYTGRLLFNTENDTLQFNKDEVAELIYILQLHYERLD